MQSIRKVGEYKKEYRRRIRDRKKIYTNVDGRLIWELAHANVPADVSNNLKQHMQTNKNDYNNNQIVNNMLLPLELYAWSRLSITLYRILIIQQHVQEIHHSELNLLE